MITIQKQAAPSQKQAYLLRDSNGERQLINKQVIKILADAKSTGNLFGLVQITGSKGEESPLHLHHTQHEAIYVTDGLLQLTINNKKHMLASGDYAHLPAGTVHQYVLLRNRTKFYSFTTGGYHADLYRELGETHAYMEPLTGTATSSITSKELDKLDDFDIRLVDESMQGPQAIVLQEGGELPDTSTPYVIEAGAGEGMLAADQLFTFLATQATTDEQFLALTTEGYPGEAIPPHYHEKHTECFLCLEGRMTMWAGDEEFHLEKGDFLHVPANTEHSFKLDSPYTKFIGFLASGLFEQFFRLLGEPYAYSELPKQPGAFSFQRVLENIDELDLKFPQR
ncbi:quercetin 2,3-dioxygenase [Terribacillus sp. DMT04]|uniref:quercetin 2,3-dioxygenase n=1 Tax=Terribacillus sp. DMT04 TaxID=2850441 RepID=UPI001C2BC139|nr:quercetin 2,3-dioxygenase [Terribacillus sp. DMT04]QXE01454.1 quercetin 2,3-dioxygenase [Terribacillus sp. DMT04]